jgi:hypothetical protein
MKRIYPLVILLALAACHKDAPDAGLPPATQEGKNTGGCLINGERFVATGWGGSLLSNPIPPLSGGFAFDSLYWLEVAGQIGGKNARVSIFLTKMGRNPPRTGSYLFNSNTPYYPQSIPGYVLNHATYTLADSNRGEVYVTDSQHTGQTNIIYVDYSRGISAGTFEFTAASTFDPTKTVTVTSGRFDRQQ